MTQFAFASMTIYAPVAAATSGRTRLIRRGAADARADAIVAKASENAQYPSRRSGRGARHHAAPRERRGRRGGVGVFDDDVDAGEDAGEDDAAAPLDLDADLDALLEADSLDDSADEEDAPLPGDAADDEASGRLLDDAFDSEPEPEEARVVLGGPVTDAFSQLVLAMRAKGHGETTTADAGAGGPGEITSYSSFANPTPWSTFDKMHAGEVKNCLGDVRRHHKADAPHPAPGRVTEHWAP